MTTTNPILPTNLWLVLPLSITPWKIPRTDTNFGMVGISTKSRVDGDVQTRAEAENK